MAKRTPPAVQWRVAPSSQAVRWVIALQLLAAGFLLLWLLWGAGRGQAWGWRALLATASWCTSSCLWWLWLKRRAHGTLIWSEQQWLWRPAPGLREILLLDAPEVFLDVQQAMLLRLEVGQTLWLWVTVHQSYAGGLQVSGWGDLRRAVYSSHAVRSAVPLS